MIQALVFVLAIATLGWFALDLLRARLSRLEQLGLSFGIGAGISSFAIFLVSLLGLSISLATGIALYFLFLIPLIAWKVCTFPKQFSIPTWDRTSFSKLNLVLIAGIASIVVAVFAITLYWPPSAWDALAIWLLKGKLIAAKESLELQALAAWPFYPLNIPLQVAYLYFLDTAFVLAIFPVYFLSLILIFCASLEPIVGRRLALISTLFLSITPYLWSQATNGYANVAFGYYYVASAIYLYRYLRERENSWLVLSGVLIGLAGWTRSEGLLYLAINLAVLVLFSGLTRKIFLNLGIYLALFLALWMPWTIYQKLAGHTDYSGNALTGAVEIISGHFDWQRTSQILEFFRAQVVNFNDWGMVWIAFPVALLMGLRYLRQHASIISLIGLNFGGLIYTYYSASINPAPPLQWWLTTGFSRMALHWMPLIVFYGALVCAEFDFSKMKRPNLQIDPYLILLILFSIFAITPLTAPGYFWGAHDGRHSVYFLFEFDRSIQDGIFYPRWAPDYTFGYGYPMFNIYAPGSLYASEALHLIGFDFVTATKIVFALSIVLSGAAMFGFVKRITGSSRAAFVSGVAYIYIPYHIADLYVRAALAESVALIFLPLALWGFYETVLAPNRVNIIATAFAYAAMMFSHNGIALMFTLILGTWILFLMLNELKSRQLPITNYQSLFRLGLAPLAALALGIGLVAIFLIPAVLEYQYVRTDQWLGNYYDYTNHFAYFFQLFAPGWGFGISKPGPRDEMSFQLGVVPVLLAIFSGIAIARNPNGTRRIWIFFAAMAGILALFLLSISAPLWQLLRPILSFAQFPWRLLTLTTVPLAILAGAIVVTDEAENSARDALPAILLGALIVLGSFPYLNAPMIVEPKEGPVSILGLFRFQQSAGEMTGSTAWVKEIPDWSPIADVYFAGKKLRSKIDYTHIDPEKLWIGVLPNFAGLKANGERIVFHAQEDTTITFNTFYYPGWRAYLTKPQTTDIIRELRLYADPNDPLGRIRVDVPQGQEQWLMVRFDDSPPRVIGAWISAFSILLALGVLVWDRVTATKGRWMKDEK